MPEEIVIVLLIFDHDFFATAYVSSFFFKKMSEQDDEVVDQDGLEELHDQEVSPHNTHMCTALFHAHTHYYSNINGVAVVPSPEGIRHTASEGFPPVMVVPSWLPSSSVVGLLSESGERAGLQPPTNFLQNNKHGYLMLHGSFW